LVNLWTFAETSWATFDQRDPKIKPCLFEKKILKSQDFYWLSDGFKKVFAKDPKDLELKVPIAGFGGHIRGDRS